MYTRLLSSSVLKFLSVMILAITSLCVKPALSEQDIPSKWSNSPHADSTSESFTHWDDEGKIPANCATCHSGEGFQDFLGHDGSNAGVTDRDHATGSLVDCDACHNDTAKERTSVEFPSGIRIDDIQSSSQCLVCHQGRSSTPSVDKKLGELPDDTVDTSLAFINIHYRAAAATLFGAEVMGGYQYKDKEYEGRFNHVPGLNTCSSCHDAHSLQVRASDCSACHVTEEGLNSIRTSSIDFDGDSNKTEGIAAEIQTFHTALGEAIMDYSAAVANSPVVYSPGKYPYFFNDLNGNRLPDDNESIYPNRYQSWTPRLLRAAYNYQFAAVDTGAYAHNPRYVIQLVHDSLADLNNTDNLSQYTRP